MSVPDLLEATGKDLGAAREAYAIAVREVAWGYQDLLAQGRLPDGVADPGPATRDAVFSEYATRAVLPHHLPKITALVEVILGNLRELTRLVQPLPAPVTNDQPAMEVSSGE